MTRDRDLDRMLDAWLRPGPTVMSTQFLDGVLERVDRQPQRRLARLTLRFPPMRPLSLIAATALLGLLIGTAALVGSRPAPDTSLPSPNPSAVAPASPSTASTPTPTRSPTPEPTPAPTPPSTTLTQTFDSPGFAYSLQAPDGYRLYPATEAWDPAIETDMASPWLERIRTDDNIQLVTARSVPLDPPLDSEAWRRQFETFPGSPKGEPGCTLQRVEWQEVEVDGRTAYEYHEHCGPTWLVVSTGDRGYVFTWRPQIDDSPEMRALFDPVWEAIRGSIRLGER
jgi:hypothetical protein